MVTPQIKELLLMLPSASLILSSFQVFMFTDSWPFASNRGSSKTWWLTFLPWHCVLTFPKTQESDCDSTAQWVQKLPINAGDVGLIPGWGRSPGGGNGNPFQYSCLENSTDRGAWGATIPGVAQNHTPLRDWPPPHAGMAYFPIQSSVLKAGNSFILQLKWEVQLRRVRTAPKTSKQSNANQDLNPTPPTPPSTMKDRGFYMTFSLPSDSI